MRKGQRTEDKKMQRRELERFRREQVALRADWHVWLLVVIVISTVVILSAAAAAAAVLVVVVVVVMVLVVRLERR